MTAYVETATVFESEGNSLVGIATAPEVCSQLGVLILVGGPQYRVGSHRLFTRMSRALAVADIASFRFDYAGMGDSDGDPQSFHEVENDIVAAIDEFLRMVPSVKKIVLWGLCDAASLALMYAHRESRVTSMVLLNPWVHAGDYSPGVKLTHYYGPMLAGVDTWKRIFRGQIDIWPALREFASDTVLLIKKYLGLRPGGAQHHPFVSDMLKGLERYRHKSLIVLSGQDLTAQEFVSLAAEDRRWQRAIAADTVRIHEILQSDHTFSKSIWAEEMTEATVAWVRSLEDTH